MEFKDRFNSSSIKGSKKYFIWTHKSESLIVDIDQSLVVWTKMILKINDLGCKSLDVNRKQISVISKHFFLQNHWNFWFSVIYCRECVSAGSAGCTNPQIFGTSPFAAADFEASCTMCSRCFETQSSPGCTLHPHIQIPNTLHTCLIPSGDHWNSIFFIRKYLNFL